MDSLLYLGAGDGDDDDDEEEEEEEEEEEVGAGPSAGASTGSVDYEALERAGLKKTYALTETETYKRLGEEAKRGREEAEAKRIADEQAEEARLAAIETMQSELLDKKKIDERLGYKKRYAETGEDFRQKEKRKRSMGQQSRDSNYVEEEKRRLRHGVTGNYDS